MTQPYGEGFDEAVKVVSIAFRRATNQMLIVVRTPNGALQTGYWGLLSSGAGDHTRLRPNAAEAETGSPVQASQKQTCRCGPSVCCHHVR